MLRLRLTSSTLLRQASHLHACRSAARFPAQMAQIPAVLPSTHDQQQQSQSGFGILQQRQFHVTRKDESLVVVGGLALAATALVGQYAVRAWSNRKPAQPEGGNGQEGAAAKEAGEGGAQEASAAAPGFSGSWFARTFYDGGFEEKMSRREAALILGVRETANAQRIKEAHRRILLLNHPDTGGSTYLATKINQAKEMLLKGK